jgi:hypothetical protein
MKKNQERRLHRKNAKIAKEGGTPMTLNRPIKPDTTVRPKPTLHPPFLRPRIASRGLFDPFESHRFSFLSRRAD